MKFVIQLALAIIIATLLVLSGRVEGSENVISEKVGNILPEAVEAHMEPPVEDKAPEPEKPLDPIKDNPNDCDLSTQYVHPDFSCTDKPVSSPPAVGVGTTTGGCEAYRHIIDNYSWDVNTMIAICNCESGGNTHALNTTPPDYSVGLFQINLYGSLALSRPSEAELYDPATNIATAYNIFTGSGYGAWTCYYKI